MFLLISVQQMQNILALDWVSLATACEALGIEKLSDQDFDFLTEFVKVFRPIADGITFVEGTHKNFGSYLPTLFSIRMTLREMYVDDELLYCRPLLLAIKEGFDKRFWHLMKLTDLYERGSPKAVPLYIAMLSNPAFKFNYIPKYWFEENPNALNQIKSIFLNAMQKELDIQTHDKDDVATAAATSTASTSVAMTTTQRAASSNQFGNY